MPTTPTGHYSKLFYNLESLIVASATFRNEIASGTTETAARDRVYWPGSKLPTPVLRPMALIRLGEGQNLAFTHSGAGGGYPTGPQLIILERAASASDTPKERALKFLNWVGAVVANMNAVARTEGYLEVSSINLTSILYSDPDESDVYDQAHLELRIFE